MIHALHGNLGGPSDWDALGLEGVRAVDLWSWQERRPGLSLEEFGAAFAAETRALDPAPVLLGYSLGGRLALHAMAALPRLWRAVILVSTHPGLENEVERAARREADARWAERARAEPWEAFLAAWDAQDVFAGAGAPGPDRSDLRHRREAVSRAFVSWSLGRQEALDEAHGSCGGPVWWITGERDGKFTALAGRAKGARRLVIPGCGHRVPMEAPGRLAEAVRACLAEAGSAKEG